MDRGWKAGHPSKKLPAPTLVPKRQGLHMCSRLPAGPEKLHGKFSTSIPSSNRSSPKKTTITTLVRDGTHHSHAPRRHTDHNTYITHRLCNVIQRSASRPRRRFRPWWRYVFRSGKGNLKNTHSQLCARARARVIHANECLPLTQVAAVSNSATSAPRPRSSPSASSCTRARARWSARASTPRCPSSTPSCTSRTRRRSAR